MRHAASSSPAVTASLACALALACGSSAPPPAPSSPPDLNDPKSLLAAVDQLQGALKAKPKTFEVLTALGNLYSENGRYLEAIDAYREALEKATPREAPSAVLAVRARRANAYYLIGHADTALAEHRKVLAESKDYPESLFFVGAILLEKSGGEDQALAEGRKYWQRLLEVAPDHPRAAIARESLPKLKELFTPKPPAAPTR